MKKKKKIFNKNVNPFQDQYFLGGAFGKGFEPGKASGVAGMASGMLAGLVPGQRKDGMTSIGGSAAKGALSGASAGAAFGPLGIGLGALFGGAAGLFTGKRQQKQELADKAAADQMERDNLSKAALSQLNLVNSSNLPMAFGGYTEQPFFSDFMNHSPQQFMDGGIIDTTSTMTGDFSNFANGGTHEENPYGGIPQGRNSNGKLRTVEEGESSFQFKEGKYIFSNRLKFE